MSDERLLPNPVGPNADFYAYLARGELRVQRCAGCGVWRHPPRHRCAACGSLDASWELVSGRGRVFTWTITHRAVDPAFTPPYAIVVAELEEGPRLVGNMRDFPVEEMALDLPITVEIEPRADTVALLWFRAE